MPKAAPSISLSSGQADPLRLAETRRGFVSPGVLSRLLAALGVLLPSPALPPPSWHLPSVAGLSVCPRVSNRAGGGRLRGQ